MLRLLFFSFLFFSFSLFFFFFFFPPHASSNSPLGRDYLSSRFAALADDAKISLAEISIEISSRGIVARTNMNLFQTWQVVSRLREADQRENGSSGNDEGSIPFIPFVCGKYRVSARWLAGKSSSVIKSTLLDKKVFNIRTSFLWRNRELLSLRTIRAKKGG